MFPIPCLCIYSFVTAIFLSKSAYFCLDQVRRQLGLDGGCGLATAFSTSQSSSRFPPSFPKPSAALRERNTSTKVGEQQSREKMSSLSCAKRSNSSKQKLWPNLKNTRWEISNFTRRQINDDIKQDHFCFSPQNYCQVTKFSFIKLTSTVSCHFISVVTPAPVCIQQQVRQY